MEFLEEILEKNIDAFHHTNCPSLAFLIPITLYTLYLYFITGGDLKNYHFESAGVIDYIHQNLDAPLITELYMTNMTCQSGYTPMVIGKWPGISYNNEDATDISAINLRFWRENKFCA